MTLIQTYSYGGISPTSSPDNNHLETHLYDDDTKEEEFSFEDNNFGNGTKPRKMGAGRRGPAAADKRATHNAIERARRESLNGRFMTLAQALPSMVNVKRPSKSIIVNKALEFVFEAQVKEHALVKENNDLRREVDQLRARLGISPLSPPAPLPLAPHRSMSNVSSATFSNYSVHSHHHEEGRNSIHSIGGGGHHASPSQSPPCETLQSAVNQENYVALPSPSPTDAHSPQISFPSYLPNGPSNSSIEEGSPGGGGGMTPDSSTLSLDNDHHSQNSDRPLESISPSFLDFTHNGVTVGGMNATAQGQAMLQNHFGKIESPNFLVQQQHQQSLLIQLQQQQTMHQTIQNSHQYQQQLAQQKLFSQGVYTGTNSVGLEDGGLGQLSPPIGVGAGNDWGSFSSYSFMS